MPKGTKRKTAILGPFEPHSWKDARSLSATLQHEKSVIRRHWASLARQAGVAARQRQALQVHQGLG